MPSLNIAKSRTSLIGKAPSWLVPFVALAPACWLLFHGQISILVALVTLWGLIVVSLVNRDLGILATLAYLVLLGDIRRVVGLAVGFPKFDPLLLVGPAMTLFIVAPILLQLRLKGAQAKTVAALSVMMLIEILNPRQGSIAVGLAGAMFFIVPLTWFWIGREYGTEALVFRIIYRVIVPLAVLAGIVGVCQTYIGFLPWQQAWIDSVSAHYHALGLAAGIVRAFGFSVNAQEYANLLQVGSICCMAAFFAGRRLYGIFFPFLALMLFLESSRQPVIKLIVAIAVAWAVSSSRGRWGVRFLVAMTILFGALALGLTRSSSDSQGAPQSAASAGTQHQIQGLSHPFDQKKSTAGLHLYYFALGFKQSFTYPIGAGIGSVTMGSKLGDDNGSDEDRVTNTEIDLSDMFVALGPIGGMLYLAAVFFSARSAIRFARSAPKVIGLAVVGILVGLLGGWLLAGQYAIAPITWFLIGTVSRGEERRTFSTERRPTRLPSPSFSAMNYPLA